MKQNIWLPRLRNLAFILGFGGLGFVLLAAVTLVWGLGREVLIIAPHDSTVVELNRRIYVPGEEIALLYGNPLSGTIRVVLPSGDKMIRPQEDTSLLLLQVDKSKGENPLQARTIWLFAKFFAGGFLILGLLGFILPRRSPAAIGSA